MRNKWVFALLAVVLLAGCSVQTYGVVIRRDKASVKLEENAQSTGESWVCIIEDTSIVKLVSQEVRPPISNEDGHSGGHQFDFQGEEEGSTKVTFELRGDDGEAKKVKISEFTLKDGRLEIVWISE